MKHLFNIILIFISVHSFGQQFDLTNDSDTIFWYKRHMNDINQLDLIRPETNKNFFRISSSKYFLQLSDNENVVCFLVNEIWDNVRTDEYFTKCFELTNNEKSVINRLYDSLKINDIPTDSKIEKW